MANNKKTAGKTAPTKKTSKPTQASKPTTVQEPPVETVEAAAVNATATPLINPEVLSSRKQTGLSPDAQVQLLGLASKHLTGPAAAERFGAAVEDKMNRIVAAGIVASMAEHAVMGTDMFAAVLNKSAYPMLVDVAKDMGITLPDMKLLPPGETEGTVQVPSSSVEVSAETAENIEQEAEIEKKGDSGEIELDPKKVAHMSEDDLKKALQYLLVTGPKRNKYSVKETLTGVVDFMHDYRIEQARQAENSTDAMNALEDRTMGEWLTDIKQYAPMTVITGGIGKGLINLASIEKSPLGAFLTLRGSLIDKETKKAVWDDKSIADATNFFISLACNTEIEKEKKALEALDTKAKDYKTVSDGYKKAIARYETILSYLTNVSFDMCDKLGTDTTDHAATMDFSRIWNQYYPDCDAAERPRYVGLDENIRQRAGIILNLFREPGNANQNYSEANLTEVTKLSLEEYQELQKKTKEESNAKKKTESKNA